MKLSRQSFERSKPMFSAGWLSFGSTQAATTCSHGAAGGFHSADISTPTRGITTHFMASVSECSLHRSCTLIGTLGTAGAWTALTIGGFSAFSMSGQSFSASFHSTVSARCSMQPCVIAVSSRRGERSTIASTTSPMIYTRPQTPNHALQRTRPSRRGCNRGVPRAGSLSLGR
jgi:hypothetical protein